MPKFKDTKIVYNNILAYVTRNGEVEISGISINWKNAEGFGTLELQVDDEENVKIDTESMGKEFFLDLMSKLYDMAEVK